MSDQKDLMKLVENIFECELNNIIDRLNKIEDPLLYLSESVETAYKTGNFFLGEQLRCGYEIISERFLNQENSDSVTKQECDLEGIFSDLLFGSNYWYIRDKIFYSYANSESLTWEEDNKNISIKLNDKSILRQLVAERQAFRLNSISSKNKKVSFSNAIDLLKNTKRFDFADPNVFEAAKSIELEIDCKISYFFSYVPEDSTINIGGYLYSEFMKVYRVIMFYAMYERHYSTANSLSNVITYTEDELVFAINQQHPEISASKKKSCFRHI